MIVKTFREGLENDLDQHIITQLRKCVNLRYGEGYLVSFLDKTRDLVSVAEAKDALDQYDNLKSGEKEVFANSIWRSYLSFLCTVYDYDLDETNGDQVKKVPIDWWREE